MPVSTKEALRRFFQLMPPGAGDFYDDDSKSGVGGYFLGIADTLAAYAWISVATLRLESNPLTMVQRVPDWEGVLGFAQSPITLTGTIDQRRNQVLSRLREYGTCDAPNLRAILAPLLGLDPTSLELIETSRAALTAAHRYTHGASVSVVPGVNEFPIFVLDDAKVSGGGIRFDFVLTHDSVEDLAVIVHAPDGTHFQTFPAGSLGFGGQTSAHYYLGGPQLSGVAVGGEWTIEIDNGGTNTGTIDTGAGLFTEGIGRDSAGNDGLGAAIFEWSLRVPATTQADFNAVRASIRRIQHGHLSGGLVFRMAADSSATALCDDDNCTADACVCDT